MSLDVRHVKKSYPVRGGTLAILTDIDFRASEGQTVSIMGPSGVGKSTLISLLAGLDSPDAGTILVDGQDLSQMTGVALNAFRARKIGLVFQQFHLVDHLTALDNVRLALSFRGLSDTTRPAQESLERLGLKDRLDHYPHELSRGECQRVAIARVLVAQPRLILADEPTGSLDQTNAHGVFQALLQSARELKAVLVLVTHDPELGRLCDQKLRLADGRLHGA
jgi:putative ABC transport system ATP-binding protein